MLNSLYAKLSFYFLVVIVLTLSGVGIAYTTSSKELDELAENQMGQIVGNAVHHTDLYLKDYERSMTSLTTVRYVKEFIDLPADREPYDYYYYRKWLREVVVDPLFIQTPNIGSIYLISGKGNALYYYNKTSEQSFGPKEIEEQREQLLRNTDEAGGLSFFMHSIVPGSEENTLTLARRIRGFASPALDSYLAIELRAADLSALWDGVDMGKYGYLFILDANGGLIYHPDDKDVGEIMTESFRGRLDESGSEPFFYEVEGERRMYMSKPSDYSGWRLVVSMPVEEVRKPVSNLRTTILTVGLVTLLLAVLLAYRFGRSITRPIQTLKSGMRQTEKGNWAPIPLPKHRDEIVELMLRYNQMVKRLSDAVDKVVQVELHNQEIRMERQKAEFQSLQLQINPHFMYNTLETIVCYAVVQDSEEISEIVKSMAYMLRYSVQTNVEEVTVANELKHVMYYMNVMQHRVGRDFEIDVAIEPRFLLKKMVRLTLQPLVENVFQHAFSEGVEDYHYIRIDCGEEQGRFWLSVEDNGCGMPSDRLRRLHDQIAANRLAEEATDAEGNKGGIGVINVHRRVQMVFGDEYGLTVTSEEGVGTVVRLMMPAS